MREFFLFSSKKMKTENREGKTEREKKKLSSSLPQSLRSPEALICHSCGAGGLLPPGGRGCPGRQPSEGAREVNPSLLASGHATAATAAAGGGRPPPWARRLGCLPGGAGEASRRSWRREQEAFAVERERGGREGARERRRRGVNGEQASGKKRGEKKKMRSRKMEKTPFFYLYPFPPFVEGPLDSARDGALSSFLARLREGAQELLEGRGGGGDFGGSTRRRQGRRGRGG